MVGMVISFRTWLEGKDIFGFEKERRQVLQHETDPFPLDKLSSETVLAELSRLSLGPKPAIWEWQDHIDWGDYNGAVRLQISPLGSWKGLISRKITDLDGETVWITKKIIRLK